MKSYEEIEPFLDASNSTGPIKFRPVMKELYCGKKCTFKYTTNMGMSFFSFEIGGVFLPWEWIDREDSE